MRFCTNGDYNLKNDNFKTRDFSPLIERVLKYFSSIAAVKIGKKKCVQSFVNKWLNTLFLPIFTAAIHEKYFSTNLIPKHNSAR